MRIRPWQTLIVILLITLAAVWIDLPGTMLDINGIKAARPVRQGLDLQGGLQVLLEARPPAGETVDEQTLEGTRNTIERRVNALGVSEPLIQTRGDDQIVVELPGVADPQEAINLLQETALLEIIDPLGQFLPEGTTVTTELGGPTTVAATPGASPAASPVASPVSEAVPPADGPVYETVVSGREVEDAFVTQDPTTRQWYVAFELSGDAGERFFEYTSANLGRPMSIVLDKQVISSPVIQAAIGEQGTIQGSFTFDEAQQLAIQIRAGALAVPLEVASSRTVGPTLGQDSIDQSLTAGIVGLAVVALFMVIYYRLPGLLSVLALLVYTALTFALFKLIPVTLTLAGIAGFILSIGMAVDANVLIFARLKEELRNGQPLRRAIEGAFNHSWPSIRDSNVATLITCAILYWFGQFSGASIITGFAVTLFVGVAVSLFSAITVSRTLLRVVVELGIVRDRWWYGVGRGETPATSGAAD